MTLAERIQRQDIVAFPTVEDAEEFLRTQPLGVISWLLECLEQTQ